MSLPIWVVSLPVDRHGRALPDASPTITATTLLVSPPPDVSAFENWRRVHARSLAPGSTPSVALLDEGLVLATARRQAFRDWIANDPRAAVAYALNDRSRDGLPDRLSNALETPVSGVGLYAKTAHCSHGDDAPHSPSSCRIEHAVLIGGRQYAASIYGARLDRHTQENASLVGVAAGDRIALHEHDFAVRAARQGEPGRIIVLHRGRTIPLADDAALAAWTREHLSSLAR